MSLNLPLEFYANNSHNFQNVGNGFALTVLLLKTESNRYVSRKSRLSILRVLETDVDHF